MWVPLSTKFASTNQAFQNWNGTNKFGFPQDYVSGYKNDSRFFLYFYMDISSTFLHQYMAKILNLQLSFETQSSSTIISMKIKILKCDHFAEKRKKIFDSR